MDILDMERAYGQQELPGAILSAHVRPDNPAEVTVRNLKRGYAYGGTKFSVLQFEDENNSIEIYIDEEIIRKYRAEFQKLLDNLDS